MNHMPSREFQLNYQRLDEPVTVMARSRTLGTWYPKGTEPDEIKDALPQSDVYLSEMLEANDIVRQERDAAWTEIKYLKSELAKRLTTKVPPVEQILTNVHAPSVAVRVPVKPDQGFARGVVPGFGHSSPAPKGKS